MSARDTIADAANTVTGVNVSPRFRQSLKVGDGVVWWVRREREAGGFGWVDTWQVFIALPQDMPAAEKWLTDTMPELVEALDTELFVTAAEPIEFRPAGINPINGVAVTGTRPAD